MLRGQQQLLGLAALLEHGAPQASNLFCGNEEVWGPSVSNQLMQGFWVRMDKQIKIRGDACHVLHRRFQQVHHSSD